MSTSPYDTISTKATPQNQKIPGVKQKLNNAGGYSFKVDKWTQLNRFLIIGSAGGSYYVSEKDLTTENAELLIKLAAKDGKRFVDEVVAVSTAGRAPKVQPAIFALAVAASSANDETRKLALAAVPSVCRTGTHLFTFVKYLKQFRGTGSRGVKRALASWYLDKPVDKVAYQAIKYRNREGFTHRDILRIAHPKTADAQRAEVFDWITHGSGENSNITTPFIIGFEKAQSASTAEESASILSEYNLPWEALKPEHLNDPAVQNALLDGNMPYGALVRQLPRFTRSGVAQDRKKDIVTQLTNPEAVQKSLIHPITLLNALVTYNRGLGQGGRDWTPVSQISDAIDDAFYLAFGNIVPADKRTLLALDVSVSMSFGPVAGMALTAREISAAMAMVTARTESDYEFMGFSSQFVHLGITAKDSLKSVVKKISGLPFSSTDCARPMLWALQNNLKIDTFAVYTDNETWAGQIHPTQALQQYREKMGIDARLVVCATSSSHFTIADPNDRGMLDIAGFDTATPNLITDFSRGDL